MQQQQLSGVCREEVLEAYCGGGTHDLGSESYDASRKTVLLGSVEGMRLYSPSHVAAHIFNTKTRAERRQSAFQILTTQKYIGFSLKHAIVLFSDLVSAEGNTS
mmetsp:Transcript_11433/g.42948  ORF Transcript_11433/g.42948 Transcript_11433/m.42948 type:complete len:104 (-) Transcript_11433:148-459(-)